ncbi:MAG TPA: SHOCT domain-containing protein [Acidimicrobiales bacterium]
MMRYGYYQDQGGGLLLVILLIVFLGAIAWLIISSMQHRHHHGPGPWSDQARGYGQPPAPGRDDDPMRILDRRFASGEIDEDEYQRRRKLLGGNP